MSSWKSRDVAYAYVFYVLYVLYVWEDIEACAYVLS